MTATQDWSDLSLFGLFRLEVETQMSILSNQLMAVEQSGMADSACLDTLMRAAHSIKGAARIVQVDSVVKVSHSLEDFFVAAGQGVLQLTSDHVDVLLLAGDFISRLSVLDEAALVAQPDLYEADANTIVLSIEGLVTAALRSQSEDFEPVDSSASHPTTASATVQPVDISADFSCLGIDSGEQKSVEQESVEQKSIEQKNAERDPVESNLTHSPKNSETASQALLDERMTVRPEASQAASARMVRMSADNLNRLMGLAGESLVEANWLQPFATSLLQLKRQQQSVLLLLQRMDQAAELEDRSNSRALRPDNQLTARSTGVYERTGYEHTLELREAIQGMQSCHSLLSNQLSDLDLFSRRFGQLSDRLYREVIASHMCAFETGSRGYSRLVRDLARKLGKQVSLEVVGAATQVDRDILEKLDAPITHLLTNAVAHGIEPPNVRSDLGKPPTGKIQIEAVHRSGMLLISVEDDGGGIDFQRLRQKIVSKGMTPANVVDRLSEAELIEFLFLPGFSTAPQVDKVAGRGYGLDIARNMVQSVGGALQATSVASKGTRFQFQLPLTLSVVRSLLLEIDGEPYAMSLARIGRVLRLRPDQIRYSENRPYFSIEGEGMQIEQSETTAVSHTASTFSEFSDKGENVSLVSARTVLGLSQQPLTADEIWVVVLGESGSRYGLCVDRILEEKDLVVRPLDERLGKVPNVSSAALTETGEPILILDVADVLQSAAKFAAGETALLSSANAATGTATTSEKLAPTQKRILVVDDSMTVRAMEKKLLQNKGYVVDMAVNGAEGWNALRMNRYDLVITDIDMPRMSGIELIEHMRGYGPTQKLPVIVVSYKDREADQLAGLNAGANYYLTKSSFHDDGLITAVVDLIGAS
ncbi:MAG: response regulator [Cyanobacteria bacterium J06649_4]